MFPSKRTIIILHDLFMCAAAWQLAWLARFNFEFPYPYWKKSLYVLPLVVLLQAALFFQFRLYLGRWRFASLPDLWNITRAAVLGTLCITLLLFVLFRLDEIPRSIPMLYPVFLIFLLGGPRLTYRFLKERRVVLDTTAAVRRVLVIGAGRAGEMLVREMLRDPQYFPVGFLDDRPSLANTEMHGIRVLGPVSTVGAVCERLNPDLIVIAVPSASNEEMQRIVELCENTGVPLRTLPGLSEMVTDGPMLTGIREVSIEDLLSREKVQLDWQTIEAGLTGRVVLVSGGGGSVGAELCRQIARLAPARLIVVDRSEFNLYRIQNELLQQRPTLRLEAVLGDICDERAIDRLLREQRPEVIFHAAAYKHVAILQEHIRAAVVNNVFGTAALADAARAHGCGKFVLISTDKAVSPTSVLGASKRVAELICESRNSPRGTRFITVRFGNVLGSDGSAIPRFQEQIRRGGPVTVTHPEVTRYFMTVSEACELILQAGAMGQGGEVYVLDMGEPVRILYLAQQLIRLSGAVPGRDIQIQFTGLVPGEKLREELFHDFEQREPTAHRKILLARHPEIDRSRLDEGLARLRQAAERWDEEAMGALLRELSGNAPLRGRMEAKVVPLSPPGTSA